MEQERGNGLSPTVKLYNIILLGITFMLIFTGYATCGMIEQTVLNSFKKEHEDFRGDGFTSLAIVYGVVSIATWFAPSILSVFGPKYSMIMAGTIYTMYISNFIKPSAIILYICSVLQGLASAVLWTSQGTFITINSDELTMGRNSAIFVAMSQSSGLFGNLYVYLAWHGVTTITDHQRIPLMIGLAAVTGFGTFCMLFLRSHPKPRREEVLSINVDETAPLIAGNNLETNENEASFVVVSERSKTSKVTEAWIAFKNSLCLLKQRDMLELSILSGYMGVQETFWVIYVTSVGETLAYGEDGTRLVGLSSTLIGAGEIIGGVTVGILNMYTSKHGRGPGVLLGTCIHMLTFFLVFLNTPDISTEHSTRDFAYIKPNEAIALASAFLFGFGDAVLNTQLFAIYGLRYSEDSAPAYALSCFVQSGVASVALFYGGHLVVKWQLLILVITLIPGSLCFIDVDQRLQRKQRRSSSE